MEIRRVERLGKPSSYVFLPFLVVERILEMFRVEKGANEEGHADAGGEGELANIEKHARAYSNCWLTRQAWLLPFAKHRRSSSTDRILLPLSYERGRAS